MSSTSENVASTKGSSVSITKGYFSLGSLAYRLSFSSVISGFCFGYDSGIVSNAMLFLVYNDGMVPFGNLWYSAVTSVAAGTAALSALVSAIISDRFGRKKLIMLSCIIEIVGSAVSAAAVSKIWLLLGRIFLGLGIGLSSVAVPVYIGESTPARIRGALITLFQLMITFGYLMSSIIAGIFSYVRPVYIGWRLMLAFSIIPAVIEFFWLLTLPESPRWLYFNGHQEFGVEILRRLYGSHDSADFEITELSEAYDHEKRSKQFVQGDRWVLTRIFKTRYVLRAVAIGCLTHIFQQLAGINTVMYYAGSIFQGAGVLDNHSIIWVSAAITGVNFLATLVPLFFLERFGRRPFLLVSVAGAIVTLNLIATFFLLINRNSIPTLPISRTIGGYDYFNSPVLADCMNSKNCDTCVNNEACGFCQLKYDESYGYCLPWNQNTSLDEYWSTVGPCAQGYDTNLYEWQDEFCRTQYTLITLIWLGLYLVFFAIGFGPFPWISNAEFYPFWARSTCGGVAAACNWGANLLVSLSYLELIGQIGKYGTFYLYAGITVVALVYMYFFIPETRGVSLEKIETLFMTGRERHLLTYIYNLQNMHPSDSVHTIEHSETVAGVESSTASTCDENDAVHRL